MGVTTSCKKKAILHQMLSVVSTLSVAVVGTVAVISTPSLAQGNGGHSPLVGVNDYSYERLAFDAADADGDGLVSEAELARDAAAGFSGLDKDRSYALTPDELAPHDPAKFARVDRNHDGKLTFNEVMTFKSQALKAADQNKDGYLSFEEMYDAAKADAGE